MEPNDRGPRQALLVIDPLRRYTEAGAPFEAEGAPETTLRIAAAARAARRSGIPVIWTTRASRPQVGMGTRTQARYGDKLAAFSGRWAELDDRLGVLPEDVVIDKPRHSAFFATDLDTVLRSWGIEELLICGFTINVCCLATAYDAVARDYRIAFVEDLCGARPAQSPDGEEVPASEVMRMTLTVVEYALGAVVRAADVALDEAEGPAGDPVGRA